MMLAFIKQPGGQKMKTTFFAVMAVMLMSTVALADYMKSTSPIVGQLKTEGDNGYAYCTAMVQSKATGEAYCTAMVQEK